MKIRRFPSVARPARRRLSRATVCALHCIMSVQLAGLPLHGMAQPHEAEANETVRDNVRFATQSGQQRDFAHISHRPGGDNPSPLPDFGDISSSDLSPLAERALGEKVMHEIRRDPDFVNDLLVLDYLNQLAERLVKAGRAQDLPGMRQISQGDERSTQKISPHQAQFEVFLVRDRAINAFALPGGYVGVHTALLLAAESESEVAAVLGHEIGHVTQKHIARMQGKQEQNALITMAALVLAGLAASKSPDAASALAMGGQALAAQNYLSFSRDAEREADRIGFQMLDAGGFDVQGAPSFFQRLQRVNAISEANLPVYVRTHPLTIDRIGDMQDRARSLVSRTVAPQLEFALVKARARVLQYQNSGTMGEVQQFFQSQAKPMAGIAMALQPTPSVALQQIAAWVGVAFVAQQDHRWADAEQALSQARTWAKASQQSSPTLEVMSAENSRAQGRAVEAVTRLEAAAKQFPQHNAVLAALAESLLSAGRAKEAVTLLQRQTKIAPQQPQWWELLASAQAAMGKRAGQHQALAEKFALQGAYPAAIEQLRIAREAGDGDFYQLSEIDARLHHFQREYLETRKDAKQ